jgi:site-specific DNA recombinase
MMFYGYIRVSTPRQGERHVFKEHRRLRTVARLLNESGYRGRKGKPFRDRTVEQLLTDPTAKGTRRANYTKMVKGKRVLKPESEWIWVPCPAIVPEELWDECNAILTKRKASHKPVAKRAVYTFAGYVYCVCGEKMYVRSNTPKYVCMRCRTKIPMVDLDRAFQSQLAELSLTPTVIADYLAKGSERLAAEEERLGGLATEAARLQGEIDFLKIRTLLEEEVVGRTQEVAEHWLAMETPEKRVVVESWVERITVYPDTVEIVLANLPSLSEMVAKGPPNERDSPAISIRTLRGRWAGSPDGPGKSGSGAIRQS